LEKQTQMPEVFTAESAEAKFAALLNEFAPSMGGGDDGDDGFDEDTLRQLAAKWYNGDEDPAVERILMAAGWEIGQDEGYEDEPGVFVVMSGDEHGKTYMSWPAEDLRSGMAEALSGQPGFWSSPPESDIETFGLQKGRPYQINSPQDFKPGDRKRAKQQLIPTQDKKDHIRSRLGKHVAPVLPEQGVTESRPDVMRHAGDTTIRVVKKGGRPIGEIGIDAEASEGNGQYYVKLYDGSYDAVGFDTAEEALAELKYAVKQSIAETTSAGGIATVPGVGGGKTAGTLFGGSYSPKTPFTAKKKAKESVIKR
jgi:hypothetical protein